jgi:MFS family permease
MMALLPPSWNYWYLAFWAQVFGPISVDALFTVGLLIVSNSFPEETQGLSGAVFNTVLQFGQSLGLGLCQVVALGVMENGHDSKTEAGMGAFDGVSDADLLRGYRASFWVMFASMVACGLIAIPGLRKAGKVGIKRE